MNTRVPNRNSLFHRCPTSVFVSLLFVKTEFGYSAELHAASASAATAITARAANRRGRWFSVMPSVLGTTSRERAQARSRLAESPAKLNGAFRPNQRPHAFL